MINIKYPSKYQQQASDWQARLDTLFAKYTFTQDDSLGEPLLMEGAKQASGVGEINNYVDELARLVAGWYEDRCDKYEFESDEK